MKLYKTSEGTFNVDGKEFSLRDLFINCEKLGLDSKDLEYGLVVMMLNDHNVADFGDMHGTFLFSEKVSA